MSDNGILIVTEDDCKQLMDSGAAFDAVRDIFGRMASGEARNFPVVREAIGHADALYGFKSGFDRSSMTLGVKGGGYWPGNMAQGLTNHQSTVCLFDPDTGRLSALVGGNYLTAIRTAAASAVSIATLSRENSTVLGMIGAGHQAGFQLRAAAEQRDFEKVIAWNYHPEYLPNLGKVAEEVGLPFEAATIEQVCVQADVIITITSSFAPLLMNDWIRPGTHIACMGTDTRGKQEVESKLVASAKVFTDEIDQSTSIGEAQHAFAEGLITKDRITPLGDVINGTHPGRSDDDDITLFDSTGVGLQDLAVAGVAARKAMDAGNAQTIQIG
ncbi:MAG: ornithine cyclodeaminase family protein [Gammaproteobacteria bacterium]|nr:ornithine cyclodeaminase family protein [Gammaproteobacteria bacterium]